MVAPLPVLPSWYARATQVVGVLRLRGVTEGPCLAQCCSPRYLTDDIYGCLCSGLDPVLGSLFSTGELCMDLEWNWYSSLLSRLTWHPFLFHVSKYRVFLNVLRCGWSVAAVSTVILGGSCWWKLRGLSWALGWSGCQWRYVWYLLHTRSMCGGDFIYQLLVINIALLVKSNTNGYCLESWIIPVLWSAGALSVLSPHFVLVHTTATFEVLLGHVQSPTVAVTLQINPCEQKHLNLSLYLTCGARQILFQIWLCLCLEGLGLKLQPICLLQEAAGNVPAVCVMTADELQDFPIVGGAKSWNRAIYFKLRQENGSEIVQSSFLIQALCGDNLYLITSLQNRQGKWCWVEAECHPEELHFMIQKTFPESD